MTDKTIMAFANLPVADPQILAALVAQFVEDEELLDLTTHIAMEMVDTAEEEKRRRHPNRIEGYVEQTVPLYSNQEFKAHFRMEKGSFELFHQVLGRCLTATYVTIDKKLLETLWLLGNQESFRGVADRFGLSKGTLHHVCMEVCEALKYVQPQFISWPTRQQQTQIARSFLHKTGFPGVVGCIDGTHIPISAPSDHRASYINRKDFPSIQMQPVCDDNLLFLDVYTGFPGSVADARVFRNCPLHGMLEGGNLHEDHPLLGDSAYALTSYMMVPFRVNGHLTDIQIN